MKQNSGLTRLDVINLVVAAALWPCWRRCSALFVVTAGMPGAFGAGAT